MNKRRSLIKAKWVGHLVIDVQYIVLDLKTFSRHISEEVLTSQAALQFGIWGLTSFLLFGFGRNRGWAEAPVTRRPCLTLRAEVLFGFGLGLN